MSDSPARAAVALLSGGLDSATAAAWAQAEGYAVHALSIDYGQRAAAELAAAAQVAQALGLSSHTRVRAELDAFGGSALTADIEVPRDRPATAMGAGIPVTYVPARNTVFLALALAAAEARGASAIVLGVNAVDYSGYPDCRPDFLAAFEEVARLGTRAGHDGAAPRLLAPLVQWSKAEIILAGTRLGVPYELTLSCYDPVGGRAGDGGSWTHCGGCDACQLRRAGFAAAGVADPTRYAKLAP